MTDRRLDGWLPPLLGLAREYRVLLGAEQPEIDGLWLAVRRLWAEQFIDSAGEEGILRREGMMRLPPAGDLETRRGAVLARWRETPPFTKETLETVLTELCGAKRFETEMDAVRCELIVRLAPSVAAEAVTAMLARRLPANIAVKTGLLFISHRRLAAHRHRELAARTHKELVEEAI